MSKVYEWVKPDWSMLEASFSRGGEYFVGEQDMDQFVADCFVKAELKTGISMETFIENNLDFFEAKEELFSFIHCLEKDNHRLLSVEELLRIPD